MPERDWRLLLPGAVLVLAACANSGPGSGPKAEPAARTPVTGVSPADLALAARVKAALDADPELYPFDLAVAVRAGEVILRGSCQTGAQMLKAGRIATALVGAAAVSNRIAARN
ncbi:BON domain-containing protein [Chitinilyticum litopenaei]|uniref:BON domain-containing protein n=1 Tax=Chitinilyticum litopenaei TaxID=1121276 RepID=UPI0003FBDD02|nr:BON domain-containing protein [Chitinilyticum litopenaei]